MKGRMFVAGIMQGSHRGPRLHDQQYRQRVRQLLATHLPDYDVYDPFAEHQTSLGYDDQLGQTVFFQHNRMCAEVDVVVAFVPEASMGTAIEMWQAHCAGRAVITISPLTHNWAVRYLSDAVYPDVEAFAAALAAGEVARTLERVAREKQPHDG